jgi:hypothetical protein
MRSAVPSVRYTFPEELTAKVPGASRRAAVAGPPSPLKLQHPMAPLPATVLMTSSAFPAITTRTAPLFKDYRLSRNCSWLTPESPAVFGFWRAVGLQRRDEGLVSGEVWKHFERRPVRHFQSRISRVV